MKIRFYHWWIYSLFRWVWTPIFVARPAMTSGFIVRFHRWLEQASEKNAEGKTYHDTGSNNGRK